jgi:integrase
MPKAIYERRVLQLNPQNVIVLHDGHGKKGLIREYRDTKSVGLTLRIMERQAVWYLRRRDMTLRLGLSFEIELWKARYIADHTRLAAQKKRDLRTFVKAMVRMEADPGSGKKSIWSAADADMIADEKSEYNKIRRAGFDGQWTWAHLTHHFLEYKKPRLKERYREKYARYLELDAFKAIADKLVSELKPRDLEGVRDQILIDHAPSAAHRAVRQGKEMLSWAWKYSAAKAGLDECQYEWWLRWSFEYKTKKRRRSPTIEEIARTLLIAESHRNLAKGEHETYPGTLGALWGVALTGQRTGSFLLMRRDRLFEAEKVGKSLRGWKVVNWNADEMKGGRDGGRSHSLPIPPNALSVLDRFHQEAGGDSPWMFPSKDPRNPVTPSALNLLIYRLQGRVFDPTVKRKPNRPGKPGPKPSRERKTRENLFEKYGIRHWSPHDVRRTMTTFLTDRRLGGAAAAILGHKMPHEDVSERELLAPVTELHYNLSQKIDLKAEGMKLWVDALLTACRREARTLKHSANKKESLKSPRRSRKSLSTEAVIA